MASQTQRTTTQQLEGVRLVIKAAENISSLTNQTLENSQHMNRTIAAELASEAKMLLQSIDRFNLA
jgi:methyl-accepting chemotaxis protein